MGYIQGYIEAITLVITVCIWLLTLDRSLVAVRSLMSLSDRTSQFHTRKQWNPLSHENKNNAHLLEKAISFEREGIFTIFTLY